MKLAPLLLFLPLLYPCNVLAARPLAKPDLRADGRYEFLDRGRPAKFRIANDELQKTGPKGERKITISAKDHLRKVQDDAKRMATFDERVEMVAYEEGKPETEANRRIVTNKVAVSLDEGVDPTAVGLAAGAITMRDVFYSPLDYVMEFPDGTEALKAAEALKTVPGIRSCTVLLAAKIRPHYIPIDPLFTNGGALRYANDILEDASEVKAVRNPIRIHALRNATNPFQWYLDNPFILTSVLNTTMLPEIQFATYEDKDLPPFVEPVADKIYPKYFDIAADINVVPAWDEIADDASLIDGTGVRVAVMDDGVQINPIHPDLNSLRIDTREDYNFLDSKPNLANDPKADNPTPPFQIGGGPNHGTAVAGLILARRDNARGMTGIAPDATLIAYRMIGAFVSPERFADAMAWGTTLVAPQLTPDNPFGLRNGNEWRRGQPAFHISNNSWGHYTFGSDLFNADPYLRKAIAYGVREGRIVDGSPRGVVYVFSAGNDGENHGDANMDAITNNIYTLTIGGISDLGRRISYSTYGAAVHAVAPTGGDEMAPRIMSPNNVLIPPFPPVVPANEKLRAVGWTLTPDDWDNPLSTLRGSQQIVTLDVPTTTGGVAGYNPNFNGTSDSAPIATGVVALMLEANPKLGWRDVQEIIMRSSTVVDPMYGEWSYNNIGTPMSHKYGAGLIDALHAVRMAKVWRNLGGRFGQEGAFVGTPDYREPKGDIKTLSANLVIPDNLYTNPNKADVSIDVPAPNPALRVEHVVVRVKIRHGRRGDLGIALLAPATGQADQQFESFLFVPHREDFNADIGMPDEPDSGGDRGVEEGEYYDFVSVRHWGAGPLNPVYDPNNTAGTGNWTLKIWDNTNQGIVATANPTAPEPQNRPQVSIANPAGSTSRIEYAAVIFHGTDSESGNEAPVITNLAMLGQAAKPFSSKIVAITDLTPLADDITPRAPITDYRIRVLGATVDTTPELRVAPSTLEEYLVRYPDPSTVPPPPVADLPHLRFDRATGELTNAPYPSPDPSVTPPNYFQPLPKGVWNLELRATNIFGTTRRLIPFTVKDQLTYLEWKEKYFTAPELLDQRISGDNADPDFDGIPNKLEYGMGGIPDVPNPALRPVITFEGGNMIFQYQVDLTARPAGVIPEVSSLLSPLATWTPVPWVEAPPNGEISMRTVTLPIVPGNRQFIRLRY